MKNLFADLHCKKRKASWLVRVSGKKSAFAAVLCKNKKLNISLTELFSQALDEETESKLKSFWKLKDLTSMSV